MTASTILDFAGRLASGKASLIGAWIGLPDPILASHLAQEDFDAIIYDMQHGMADLNSVTHGIAMSLAAGKPALARIPVGEFATASRLLDAGARGIIAPMINSVTDAKTFAQFVKYPPVGERSWGPGLALNHMGLTGPAYLAQANTLTASIAMIETRAAMAALDDILSVPGIDGVFVGPSDLSIALANGAQVAPNSAEVNAALSHILQRARAHGKSASVFCMDGEISARLLKEGYDLVIPGSETMQIRAGAAQAIAAARKGARTGTQKAPDRGDPGPSSY